MSSKIENFAAAAGLLDTISRMNESIIASARGLLEDRDVCRLRREYESIRLKREVDLGFNVFAMVSELYHRENFHSDVLRALLDPCSKHGDGDIYLKLFLTYLQCHGANVDALHYNNACVVREAGRIDLLIKDEESKHAIIVENKINGAADMQRQLPRYMEHAKDQGFDVDAIVYLKLEHRQHPDKAGWSNAEKREIEEKLLCLSVYDETDDDLFNGWLQLCEEAATDLDARHIFRQYRQLIKKLGKNIMNKPIMHQFYTLMMKGDNYRSAQSLRGMLEDLVLFRVVNIMDHFKGDLAPFTSIANWKDADAYFTGCSWEGAHLGIDVGVEPDEYVFQFWDRNDREGLKGRAEQALTKMRILQDYMLSDGQFIKRFKFPEEESGLFLHIKAFKTKLQSLVDGIKP